MSPEERLLQENDICPPEVQLPLPLEQQQQSLPGDVRLEPAKEPIATAYPEWMALETQARRSATKQAQKCTLTVGWCSGNSVVSRVH